MMGRPDFDIRVILGMSEPKLTDSAGSGQDGTGMAQELQYEVREGREAVMPDVCSEESLHIARFIGFCRGLAMRYFDSTKKKPRPIVVVGRPE